jgi:hypothetical protein
LGEQVFLAFADHGLYPHEAWIPEEGVQGSPQYRKSSQGPVLFGEASAGTLAAACRHHEKGNPAHGNGRKQGFLGRRVGIALSSTRCVRAKSETAIA